MRKTKNRIMSFVLSMAMVVTSVSVVNLGKSRIAKADTYKAEMYDSLEAAYLTKQDEESGETVRVQSNHDITISEMVKACEDESLTSPFNISDGKYSGGKLYYSAYVQVTRAHTYSELGVGAYGSGASNAELMGKHVSVSGVTKLGYVHCGYGTGHEGEGIGEAGTGIYLFNVKDIGTRWSNQDITQAGIRIYEKTKDTKARILGLVFYSDSNRKNQLENGAFTAQYDETGTYTGLKAGYEIPTSDKIESNSEDSTDYTAEELAEKKAAELKGVKDGIKESISVAENLLENSENYDEATYTKYEEDLKTALKEAKDTYDDTSLELEWTNVRAVRDNLDKVVAKIAPKAASEDVSTAKDFRILSKDEVIREMGTGTNLGNTFDGGLMKATETSWQDTKTTKEYIKALHDSGYNTVRIPVTWNGYIDDENDYAIDESWISRIQEVVDYCISQDMYAIVNIHHDGAANHDTHGANPDCWLNTYAEDIASVYKKYAGTWKNIAERFKDYDEHLIFEGMNEVTDGHNEPVNYDAQVLMNLNQIFVNTVRSTGSNNTKRWLAITGRFATTSAIKELPDDTLVTKDADTTRLMFHVHIYKANSDAKWSYSTVKTWWESLSSSVKNVKALDDNMPLFVGEYGVKTNKLEGSDTGYNNYERAMNYEMCTAAANFYNVVPIVWDQGKGQSDDYYENTGLFVDWNRKDAEPIYDEVVEGIVRGTYCYSGRELAEREEDIYKQYGHENTSDTGICSNLPAYDTASSVSIDAEDDTITMEAGDRVELTANTDADMDPVIWSVEDDSIATVFDGIIHAKKLGRTVVTAETLSGEAADEITVVVTGSDKYSCTSLEADEVYELEENETLDLNVKKIPEDCIDEVYYESGNTSIVSVNSTGKITGVMAGTAFVTITASSGATKTVMVKVGRAKGSEEVEIALNAYGDGVSGEYTEAIKISDNGTYSLSFDASLCEKLDNINGLVSMYISDVNNSKVVESAMIRYDSVVVDGNELTLVSNEGGAAPWKTGEFKDALKSGVINTNDPINGWDGSVVKEVTTDSNHKVTFNDIENPQKITVTFTISDLKFVQPETVVNPVNSLKHNVENDVLEIEKVGDVSEVIVTADVKNTDSTVVAYSTDTGVASVSIDDYDEETGEYSLSICGMSKGVANIVVIAENGVNTYFTVAVEGAEVTDEDKTNPVPAEWIGEPATEPTTEPTVEPTTEPTVEPTTEPTATASVSPSEEPSESPQAIPSQSPTTAPADGTATQAPVATQSPATTATPSVGTENDVTIYVNAGETLNVGNFKYKVTAAATSKSKGAVKVTGLTSKGKKAKKITLPASIKKGSAKLNVTSLGGSAFKGAKATSITIKSKKVTKLPSKVFANCKKLKSLKLAAKLKSVNKKAFKGCKKTIKIKGTSKKANKKVIKKVYKRTK